MVSFFFFSLACAAVVLGVSLHVVVHLDVPIILPFLPCLAVSPPRVVIVVGRGARSFLCATLLGKPIGFPSRIVGVGRQTGITEWGGRSGGAAIARAATTCGTNGDSIVVYFFFIPFQCGDGCGKRDEGILLLCLPRSPRNAWVVFFFSLPFFALDHTAVCGILHG